MSKLPADVGDENGETIIDERKIRIKPLPVISAVDPKSPTSEMDLPISDVGMAVKRLVDIAYNHLEAFKFLIWIYLSILILKRPEVYRESRFT